MKGRPLLATDDACRALPGRTIRIRRSGCEPIDVTTHPQTTAAVATWLLAGRWPTMGEWDAMMRERKALVL